MARRVGFPDAFRGVTLSVFRSPDLPIPDRFAARGRWTSGPLHTFCDDYRQEFFWRRPEEGLLVALTAGVATAPDFTVWTDDPAEWADYQVWRSALVASYWQAHGVDVLPVVTFAGNPARFVHPGSAWAVRGPTEATPEYLDRLAAWADSCRPGLLVVFGRSLPDIGVPMVQRALSGLCPTAAQKEGAQ